MTFDEVCEKIKVLTERIDVLVAEKVADKYVQPLYVERTKYLRMILAALGDK